MTPKEKAQELVSSFLSINLSQLSELVDGIRIRLAKESALIAVDEMMDVYASALAAMGIEKDVAEIIASPYLLKVKQEIENL